MEEYRLRIFENRILRRIFVAKRMDGRGELCNKGLQNLNNQHHIRMIKSRSRWTACNIHRRKKKCQETLVYKTVRKVS
jgi:hypothetical protein